MDFLGIDSGISSSILNFHEKVLKSYSLMLNRGCSQNCQNLNFLHIFVAFLAHTSLKELGYLKSFQDEMRAIFTENLIHKTLFNLRDHYGLRFNTVVLWEQ